MPGPRYVSDLSSQELLDQAYKILLRDRAKTANMGYPVYPGAKVAPMSVLAQQAKALKEQSTPASYSDEIQKVLNSKNSSDGAIKTIQDMIRDNQQNFYKRTDKALQKQFRNPYESYQEKVYKRQGKDLERGITEATEKLQPITKVADSLEAKRKAHIVSSLQALSQGKHLQDTKFIDTLERFGNQKHALDNMNLQANKEKFEEEAFGPRKRMQLLEQGLKPYAAEVDGAGAQHPDIDKINAQGILKLLNNYGVDTSKPVEQWENATKPWSVYQGNRVAGIPPELQTSHNLAQMIDSQNFKDKYHDQREGIIKTLLNNDNIANDVAGKISGITQGNTDQLENQAKQQIKKDLAALANKYVRLGQYGSKQHIQDAIARKREIDQSVLEQRNKLLEGSYGNQLQLRHGNEIDDITKLNQLGGQGHKEFSDIINDLNIKNKIGTDIWDNRQKELDDIYKNYQRERNWEWPQLQELAHKEGYNTGTQAGVLQGYQNVFGGNSLDDLAKMNTRYSELEKTNKDLLAQITSSEDYYKNALEQQRALEQQQVVNQKMQHERQRLQQLATQTPLTAQQTPAAMGQQRTPEIQAQMQRIPELQKQNQRIVDQAKYIQDYLAKNYSPGASVPYHNIPYLGGTIGVGRTVIKPK